MIALATSSASPVSARVSRLARGLVLSASMMAAALFSAPHQAAAAPSCRDLFSLSLPSQIRMKAANPSREIREVIASFGRPRFSRSGFEDATRYYLATPVESWMNPRTAEAKLALINVMAGRSGYNAFQLDGSMHSSMKKKTDYEKLARSIGKIDLQRGLSAVEIQNIFAKMYAVSHEKPISFKNRKLGFSGIEKEVLLQWADREIGSKGLVEAFASLDLVKAPGYRDRLFAFLSRHPNVVATISTGAIDVIQTMMFGSFLLAPSYSRLQVTRLDPEFEKLIREEGFDAVYPRLKARYGNHAKLDQAFFWGRRAATTALMAAVLMHHYPTVMQSVLPPGYANAEAGAVQLTNDVINYYSKVVQKIVSGEVAASRENQTPRRIDTDMQLNDGAPVSSDPAPIAVVAAPPEPTTHHNSLDDTLELAAPGSGETAPELDALISDLDKIDFSADVPSAAP